MIDELGQSDREHTHGYYVVLVVMDLERKNLRFYAPKQQLVRQDQIREMW
jgi:hypothetical protein